MTVNNIVEINASTAATSTSAPTTRRASYKLTSTATEIDNDDDNNHGSMTRKNLRGESFTSRTEEDMTSLHSSFYASLHGSLPDDLDCHDSFATLPSGDDESGMVLQVEGTSSHFAASDDNDDGYYARSSSSSLSSFVDNDSDDHSSPRTTTASLPSSSSSSRPKQQQQQQKQRVMEVSPGFVLPVISASETWEAILDGRITVTSCICCSIDLHCNMEATHVLCPQCGIIGHTESDGNNTNRTRHSVGQKIAIGVTAEFIMKHAYTSLSGQHHHHQQQQRSQHHPQSQQQERSRYNSIDLNGYEEQQEEGERETEGLSVNSMSELILQWTSEEPSLLEDFVGERH